MWHGHAAILGNGGQNITPQSFAYHEYADYEYHYSSFSCSVSLSESDPHSTILHVVSNTD